MDECNSPPVQARLDLHLGPRLTVHRDDVVVDDVVTCGGRAGMEYS